MSFDGAVRIVDESPGGAILHELMLTLAHPEERLTARALIERRVRAEVAAFNASSAGALFHGLVQPTRTEAELNGYRLREPRLLDADAQCARALEAFERGAFLIVAGDHQVESLDEELALGDGVVSFIKLVPLVGG